VRLAAHRKWQPRRGPALRTCPVAERWSRAGSVQCDEALTACGGTRRCAGGLCDSSLPLKPARRVAAAAAAPAVQRAAPPASSARWAPDRVLAPARPDWLPTPTQRTPITAHPPTDLFALHSRVRRRASVQPPRSCPPEPHSRRLPSADWSFRGSHVGARPAVLGAG
jgi:hypothetical protein